MSKASRLMVLGLVCVILGGLVVACNLSDLAGQATDEPARPTVTWIQNNVAQPTLPLIPTWTWQPILPPPTDMPAPTRIKPAKPQQVLIFLIALNDNGASGELVGCGDSAVPVTVEIPATQGVLRAALGALLKMKDEYYGQSGLYNALYQSKLQLSDVMVSNGKVIIHLTGSMLMGGECDAPRIEAQLKKTALQFATVQDVEVFVNGKPLKDLLSGK